MKNTVVLIVILVLVCAGWAWTLTVSEKREAALESRCIAAEKERDDMKAYVNRIADGLHQFCSTTKMCTVVEAK